MAKTRQQLYIYAAEIAFAVGLLICSQSVSNKNFNRWLITFVRYILYMLYIKSVHGLCILGYNFIVKPNSFIYHNFIMKRKSYFMVFFASVAVLLYFNEKLIEEGFVPFIFGYLVIKYIDVTENTTVSNGVIMACSYFEGYLTHIIPSDGAMSAGFEDNISFYEAKQGIVFPVKKLFIVITKSLYCPPDLKHFNKKNTNLPYLEACRSLPDVTKDVAGVKNRTYRNSAYKIHRPNQPPVYFSAECATPLHTLGKALDKRALYEMLGNLDVAEVVNDFCCALQTILSSSRECWDKCHLVYFDDKDPNQNLADVLLNEIELIVKHQNQIS